MPAAAILDFRNCHILLAEGVQRAKMHHRANFITIIVIIIIDKF